MNHDISRAPVPAPPDASPLRPAPKFFALNIESLRARMDSLQLDDAGLSHWAALPLKQVRLCMDTGVATRAQLRRIRRGLRWRAVDLLGLGPPSDEFWSPCTLRSLAPDIEG
jgi:hypothetical protein